MTIVSNRTLIPLLVAAATTLGCSKKDEPAKSAAPEPELSAPKVQEEAPVEPAPEIEEEAVIPTAVDFEEEAATEINDESLEKELAAIEEELEN